MRALFITLAAIVVVTWLGFELRHSWPRVATVAFTLAGLLSVLWIGAFFGLY